MAKFRFNQEGLTSIRQEVPAFVESLKDEVSWPVVARAVTLGFVSGLRSMAPFALLGWTKGQNPAPTNDLEHFLDSPAASFMTSTLASGELLGDKLPNTPDRLKPGPMAGRLVIGGMAGLSIFRRYRQPLILGAVLGALGAGAGTYIGYYARQSIADSTRTPQWLLGLAEDGLAFGLGFLAVKKSREK
jgi:uncharacterized membrane protein